MVHKIDYIYNLAVSLKKIYPCISLIDSTTEFIEFKWEQILNIIILSLIFLSYFLKFLIILFYFIIYRGIKWMVVSLLHLCKGKGGMNCNKFYVEMRKNIIKTLRRLVTYNFFLYPNFSYGFFIVFIFFLFVITHCSFIYVLYYINQAQTGSNFYMMIYSLLCFECKMIFDVTCISFFFITSPLYHIIFVEIVFFLYNLMLFIAILFHPSVGSLVVCFTTHAMNILLIFFALKSIYMFDYNITMLRVILIEKNEFYKRKYDKLNPLYLKEMENISQVNKEVVVQGYYHDYIEPYFFFYKNRFLHKKRLIIFFLLLLLQQIAELTTNIIYKDNGNLYMPNRPMIQVCNFINTILMLYIAVSTFLKTEIQHKYIC